jgi:hypothetical protein
VGQEPCHQDGPSDALEDVVGNQVELGYAHPANRKRIIA